MKAIITGMNGTVAPVVAQTFKQHGYEIIPYDRSIIPVDDEEAILSFVQKHNPRVILHLALGPKEWGEMLAKICKELDITFVYISTVSVYSNAQKGPFVATDEPLPNDDYGKYKKASEDLIKAANDQSYILRIGWQIGTEAGSNNMIDFFQKQMNEHGVIKVSSRFYPSCSFITDTASAIYELITNHSPDLYLINSNHTYSLYEIGLYIKKKHPLFKFQEDQGFQYDNRMFDVRVPIKKMTEYF